MVGELFKSGRLLLPEVPPDAVQAVTDSTAIVVPILTVLFVVVALFLLPSFLHLFPFLADSLFRARGSTALEGSVRVSRDRNILALAFLIPALLIINRYRLYDPAFLQGIPEGWRLASIAGVLTVYFLLRLALYLWLKPRRRYEQYQMAHRAGYTIFILLMLLVLVTVGILTLLGCNDLTIRMFIYVETATVYLFHLVRRTQILSLSCNLLQSFLYLCALEIIPTALLVVSAVIL